MAEGDRSSYFAAQEGQASVRYPMPLNAAQDNTIQHSPQHSTTQHSKSTSIANRKHQHNTTQHNTLHRAREALRSCLPELLRNPQFTGTLKNDETTRRWGFGEGEGLLQRLWEDLLDVSGGGREGTTSNVRV